MGGKKLGDIEKLFYVEDDFIELKKEGGGLGNKDMAIDLDKIGDFVASI